MKKAVEECGSKVKAQEMLSTGRLAVLIYSSKSTFSSKLFFAQRINIKCFFMFFSCMEIRQEFRYFTQTYPLSLSLNSPEMSIPDFFSCVKCVRYNTFF